MALEPNLGEEQYCYLTTTGRVTGNPHTIEIWFAMDGDTFYLLSGGRDRSDWVRNILRNPSVTVRVAASNFAGTARALVPGEEDTKARRLLFEKYSSSSSDNLTSWSRTALPVAIDLTS